MEKSEAELKAEALKAASGSASGGGAAIATRALLAGRKGKGKTIGRPRLGRRARRRC